MNWLDIVLGGVVIISALVGLARGFIKEVLSLIAWAVALYVAWKFADMVAQKYVQEFIDDELISYLAAFGALFLVALFGIGLVNLLITQLFSATGMSGFDRLLGMLFGLARGALISALIVFFASFTPIVKEPWWQSSQLVPGFANLAKWGMAFLPEKVLSILDGGQEATGVLEQPEVQPASSLNLESTTTTNDTNTPTRPQIDSNTRSQQSAQNNALSTAGESNKLMLESIEGLEEASDVSQPPLSLESIE